MKNQSAKLQKLEVALTAFARVSQAAAEREVSQSRIADLTHARQFGNKDRLAGRLSAVLAGMPAGVLIFDSFGRLSQWNDKAIAILALDLQAGMSWQNITQQCFPHCQNTGGIVLLDNDRYVDLSVHNSDGEKMVFLTDVTESRRLEKALRQKERLSDLGEMMGRLAHQIKTPLASAFIYLSNLKRKQRSQFQSADATLDRLDTCLKDVQETVNDLLLYIRGNNPSLQEVRVSQIIKALRTEFFSQAQHRKVRVVFSCEPQDPLLRVNAHAFAGALLNLLVNSAQAGARNIHLGFAVLSGKCTITVEDDGSGINPDIAASVFEPFFTTRPDGNGLGLAIVKTVVELHGGTIAVDTSCAQGTRFEIELHNNNGVSQ